MRLLKLHIDGLRCLHHVEVEPGPGLNLLLGPNGAGKTSVLEAIHLLSRGRSFRSGGHEALIAREGSHYQVFAELDDGRGRVRRLGLKRDGQGWQLRVDGENQTVLSELLQYCAAVCFEPGSHVLISGGSAERRRFLDWGVFHVEHTFLLGWRRYQRALRQRNVLLRQAASDAEFAPWEAEMAASGELVDQCRHSYVQRFEPALLHEAAELVPMLGEPSLHYIRGWAQQTSLLEQLNATRRQDRVRGFSTVGAHRSDWRLRFPHAPNHEQLSRGQEKLAALCAVLAQAGIYAADRSNWPLVCLDDLASELDQQHQGRLVRRLQESAAQVWITGTDRPTALENLPVRVFHVEHGVVSPGNT